MSQILTETVLLHLSTSFDVYIENELTVSAASGITSIHVPYGESVDLEVNASCREGDLTYRWYNSSTGKDIEDTTGSSCHIPEVTKRHYITCSVTDQYGNIRSVTFNLYVDNELQVSAASDTSFKVPYGESVDLKVSASCRDGELSYRWYDNTSHNTITGAEGSSYTLADVTTRKSIICTVSDQYGNENSVYFYVNVDNELKVSAISDTSLYIPYGESTTLEVTASCKDNQLTYEWYDSTRSTKKIEGAAGSTCTVPEVTKKQYIYCRVSDQYGNEQSVSFYIYVDNEFKVSAASDTYLRIPYGESTTLEVSASCKDNQLTYEWFDNTGATKKIEGAAGSTYTISEVTKKQNIYCRVSDLYGNQNTVYFYRYVDNQLTASAAERVQKIPYGEAVTLTVNASCASGPLTYVWYETTSDDKKLEGYTDSFYTLSSVTEKHEYTCYVYDQYGNSSDVDFTVYVDSGFSVEDYESNVSVAPEQSITLQAPTASSIIGTISYQWYGPVYDENGYYRTEPVSGATGNSLVVENITKYTSDYYCRITDGYQSYDASFYISVDNALSIANGSGHDVNVPYGESTTLMVDASCKSGELTYTWYRSGNEMEGVSGNSFTVENVIEHQSYECRVKDQYGNSKNVWFDVQIDSGFALDDDSSRYYHIAPEESLTLQAPAATTNVPGAVISYQWQAREYNEDGNWYYFKDIEGATEAAYETGSIARSTEYYCRISDGFESRSIHYGVSIDNEFSVNTDGNSYDVKYGEDITVEVKASCAKGALTYRWYFSPENEDIVSAATVIRAAAHYRQDRRSPGAAAERFRGFVCV